MDKKDEYYIELSFRSGKMVTDKRYKFKVNKKRFNELLYQFNHYKSYERIG